MQFISPIYSASRSTLLSTAESDPWWEDFCALMIKVICLLQLNFAFTDMYSVCTWNRQLLGSIRIQKCENEDMKIWESKPHMLLHIHTHVLHCASLEFTVISLFCKRTISVWHNRCEILNTKLKRLITDIDWKPSSICACLLSSVFLVRVDTTLWSKFSMSLGFYNWEIYDSINPRKVNKWIFFFFCIFFLFLKIHYFFFCFLRVNIYSVISALYRKCFVK